MIFSRQTWIEKQTPTSAANFNRMEAGIEEGITKAEQALALNLHGLYDARPAIGAVAEDTRFYATGKAMEWQAIDGAWVLIRAEAPIAAAPPENPIDRQRFTLLASATKGTRHVFEYRAASASPYKWECVGAGRAIADEIAAAEGGVNFNFGDLTTPGPQVTAPLAGEYEVAVEFNGYNTAGASTLQAAISVASAAAELVVSVSTPGVLVAVMGTRTWERAFAAAQTIKLQYAASAGSPIFRSRRLALRPLRVA